MIFAILRRPRATDGSTSTRNTISGQTPPAASSMIERIDRVGQLAHVARQHLRRVEVTIGDDDVGARQRRDHHLLGELYLARDVEQQLGARDQREVAGVATEVANRLRHPRREQAALAGVFHGEAALAQGRRDPVGERRLSAPVDALEGDEHSWHMVAPQAVPGWGRSRS